jgi:hypothetical protein
MTEAATLFDYNKSVDVLNMPDRIKRLRVSPLGWPVPWFVTWFKDGKPCEDGDGVPDFRVVNPAKIMNAINTNRCWVCGSGPIGVHKCFVIGPMCAVNRVISEPPSHRDCAVYAARVCPFLANPAMRRNERGMYDDSGKLRDGINEPAGHGLRRNPGAVCVWSTKSFRPFKPPGGGVLFSLGLPTEVLWFAEGRKATRKEVMASIESGYPILQELARAEGPEAVKALATQREVAMALVPS